MSGVNLLKKNIAGFTGRFMVVTTLIFVITFYIQTLVLLVILLSRLLKQQILKK